MRKFITTLLEPKDNAPEAAFLLAQQMGAKITRSTFNKEVKEHPNYPGFLSISDVLNNHGVENLIAEFDKKQLPEIPTPFLSQLVGKNGVPQYTVIKEVGVTGVTFYDPEKQRWEKLPTSEFVPKCSRYVLMAEIEEPVIERDYEQKLKEEKRLKLSQNAVALVFPLILLCASVFSFSSSGLAATLPVLYTSLFFVGGVVTTLLLWYEVDQDNTALQEICTGGKKLNCGAILRSKDAKFFGVSWSTIGFVYFAGSLLCLLLGGVTNPGMLTNLSYLSLAATPYVFYSIYYQWRVARQWCPLCVSVQAVLVSQSVVVLLAGWAWAPVLVDQHLLFVLTAMVTAFAVPFMVVTLLVPALRKVKTNDSLMAELQRLKHSPEIFDAVLQKQKRVAYDPAGLGITLGNPNGSIKLVKVCNPYCGPCARAHTPIEELLHNNPDLQVQIIFTASAEETDKRSHPVKHLLAVDQKDRALTEQALDDWYLADVKDYDAFARKYPMNGELKKQDDKIAAMKDWCKQTDIQFTPTFFINGHQLPGNYSVKDLKYFLSV